MLEKAPPEEFRGILLDLGTSLVLCWNFACLQLQLTLGVGPQLPGAGGGPEGVRPSYFPRVRNGAKE